MTYGIRVSDTSGNELLVTPNILSLYGGGREATPASGTNGQTYEVDISLGDTYAETKIGVLANSFTMNIDLQLYNLNFNDEVWYQSWFVNDGFNYFTRNESTGVLTTWTPDKTSATNYDGLLSVFPTSFWDKRGGSSFSTINIFTGTNYLVYDQSTTSDKTVYTVGSEGVENVDYAIFLKQYQGE